MSALDKLLANVDYSAFGYTKGLEIAKQVATELTRLQAIEKAAREYVNEDGRGDPPAKYQVLKDALKSQ
jgi:hypothetical protein